MPRVLLIPDLALEGWRAMDRYARCLAATLPAAVAPGWQVDVQRLPAYAGTPRFVARWVRYPAAIDWRRADLAHILDHSYAHIARRKKGDIPVVVTVHDLFALEAAGRKPGLRGMLLLGVNRWVLGGLRRAAAVICDSAATLRSLRAHFPGDAPQAWVVRPGVEHAYFVTDRAASGAAFRARYGLDEGVAIVLNVGSCVPRKNVEALAAACGRLAERGRRLVLVQVGGREGEPLRRARALLGASLLHLPEVAEAELPSAYAAADVLAMPSLFEGFGFPVAEAMAAGTLAVATNLTSLAEFPREVVFDAGEGAVEEIERALESALAAGAAGAVGAIGSGSGVAAERRAAGRRWAAEHLTWEGAAAAVAAVYRAVLARGPA